MARTDRLVLTVLGLSVLGWPTVADAHDLERSAGQIALSGLVVGVVGDLAAGAVGWKQPVVAVALFLAYVVVGIAYAFAEYAVLGGPPLLVAFATIVKARQWLLRLERR